MQPELPESVAHVPVLWREFLAAVEPVAGQRWIDGTFGRGGHTRCLLERGATVLAVDCDAEAEAAAAPLAQQWADTFTWVRANFSTMDLVAAQQGWSAVDGVLLDLGVSSPQLDSAARGFSFRRAGPLDMRMDQRIERTAADVINEESEEALSKIFYEYGDEREARRIARVITTRRQVRPFVLTTDLAEVVARTIPRRWARGLHPATKVFQALRLVVNQEREVLMNVLPLATSLLQTDGTLAVISFHSGEDRPVKQFMRDHAHTLSNEGAPLAVWFSRVKRYLPSPEEITQNPRSRSARLRVAWRAATEMTP